MTRLYPMRHSRSALRRGTTSAELAVLLPLLVILCLTSVDFGRFAHVYIALGNSARVGAEYGATRPHYPQRSNQETNQIETAVRDELSGVASLNPDAVAVDVAFEPDAYDLHRVSVTAVYPFRTIVNWPMLPQPIEISRTVVIRRFR